METGNDRAPLLRLTSWEQFEQSIGPMAPGSFLGYAVRGFFENGGQRCVVVPLRLKEAQLKLMEDQLRLDEDQLSKNQDQSRRTMLTEALENLFRKDANGLRAVLSDIDDTDLVYVPDIMIKSIRVSPETVFGLQQAVLEYCATWESGSLFSMPFRQVRPLAKRHRDSGLAMAKIDVPRRSTLFPVGSCEIAKRVRGAMGATQRAYRRGLRA